MPLWKGKEEGGLFVNTGIKFLKEVWFSHIPNLRYHQTEAVKSCVAGNLEWDDVGLSWENKIEWGQAESGGQDLPGTFTQTSGTHWMYSVMSNSLQPQGL